MQIKTLRRMMVGRTVAQKNQVLTVTAKEGQVLVSKGHAVEVKTTKTDSIKAVVTKAKPKKDDSHEKAD